MTNGNMQPFDVLLVEDELADAHLVRAALGQCAVRCTLHHVVDGVEALAFLRREDGPYQNAPKPDLILLDLNMPRMNGREFLAAIKQDERFASIPVVVLTTSEVERDVDEAYRLRAAGFISKPADVAEFAKAMGGVMAYWLTLTRLPGKG